MAFNTYIDDKDMIPTLLDYGWMVMRDTWTDCPLPTYIGIKKALRHNQNAQPLMPLAHHTREMM